MFENIILNNLLSLLNTMTFSYSESARIVGGKKHLEKLILEGKVSETERNGRIYFNAKEIALHAKNYR